LAALEAVSQLYFEGVITIAEASASEDNSAIPEYKTSLPPAIQPTVADALLDTITSQTSMPAAVIPAPVDVQAIPDIQPTAAETPVYAEPPASPFESQVPKETGAPMVAKPVLPPSPPPPPPEAMGELSEAMASIPSQSGMPTEGEPSADDVSAKAAQEDTSASAQALHSAVTKKTQEDAFPEFKDPAAAKQSTEEDTFFSTDLGYEEDFDSVDMKADVSGSLDQGQEEHELSQASAGVPRLAIALAALILVGGGAFFVLRDTVEPMTVPSNSLETHWIDQKIKKQATVGAVAPIDAGWRIPNEPDGGIILDSVELAADAGNETATVGTTDEQGKTSETNAVATKTGTKETSVQKKQVKTPTATVETPRVNAEKSKRARGLTSEGIKLYKRGKFEAAIKKFETALSTSPGAKQTLVAYTKALLEMNRLRDALEAAEKVSRIDPNNGEIFLLLGNARQDLGMKTASIKAYKHYLKLEPNGSYANEIRQVIKGIQAAPN
jgi:tetratricopeptide (TPR) repeat protein